MPSCPLASVHKLFIGLGVLAFVGEPGDVINILKIIVGDMVVAATIQHDTLHHINETIAFDTVALPSLSARVRNDFSLNVIIVR